MWVVSWVREQDLRIRSTRTITQTPAVESAVANEIAMVERFRLIWLR
jgi:hypothetical protein